MTDGTQAGTRLVEDFHSISPFGVPLNLTDANGTLFFTLEGADGQEGLWKSNGTGGGTSLVKGLGTSANLQRILRLPDDVESHRRNRLF